MMQCKSIYYEIYVYLPAVGILMPIVRLVNWNVQGDQQTTRRAGHIRQMLAELEADVICLTEGFTHNLPDNSPDRMLVSRLSEWGTEVKGGRKVLLWSRWGWEDVNTLGSERLPEGRFVAASTRIAGSEPITVIGVCIPYHAYRTQAKWGERRKAAWQGNIAYLYVLREEVLSQTRYQRRTLIVGDFNQQIPAKTYPTLRSAAAEECERAFAGYCIATAGDAIELFEKPSVLHIAHTPDLAVASVTRTPRYSTDGLEVSDHHGILMRV